jgi:hypothetical protein
MEELGCWGVLVGQRGSKGAVGRCGDGQVSRGMSISLKKNSATCRSALLSFDVKVEETSFKGENR